MLILVFEIDHLIWIVIYVTLIVFICAPVLQGSHGPEKVMNFDPSKRVGTLIYIL